MRGIEPAMFVNLTNEARDGCMHTYKGCTIPGVCPPHALKLRLVLDRHHLFDDRRRNSVPEMREHERNRVRRLR